MMQKDSQHWQNLQRASLHNLSIMEQIFGTLCPDKGTPIKVFKADLIIPQVETAEKSGNGLPIPILENCPILANCVVIGDKRKFLSCLLTLKTIFDPLTGQPTNRLTPACINELAKHGIQAKTVEEAKQNPLLSTLINEGIEQYNKVAVSRAQNLRKWILLDRDLSLATGELTATLKLRRGVVQLNFKEKINQLYE